jgi:KDO2-lipid IV(A) lauroyltransferase
MLTDLAIRAGLALFQSLPEDQALRLGRGLGLFWFHAVRYRRRHVLDAMRQALGDERDEAEIHALARANFAHYGQVLAEFSRLPLLDHDALAEQVEFTGRERFAKARERGRGVVVITGHFGNWDLAAAAQAMLGLGVHVVTRRLHSASADRAWQRVRRERGIRFLEDHGSIWPILRLLRAGEAVALVLDQHVGGRRGVPARFFGRRAWTARAAAVLALRTGCAVLPVFNYREKNGWHRMTFGDEIPPVRRGDSETNVLLTTQRYNDVLEAFIREHPEQWLWAHRRWKRN